MKSHAEVMRDYYQRNKAMLDAKVRAYERTPKGFLMRKYRNMKSRVLGINDKSGRYTGKSILPKAAFYEWALGSDEFHRLWAAYVAAGFDRELAPSVDRVDSSRGYDLDNIRWITTHANSMGGIESRYGRKYA